MIIQRKDTGLNVFLCLGSHRFTSATQVNLKYQRAALADESLERDFHHEVAGAFSFPASISGNGTIPTENAAIGSIREDEVYLPFIKATGNTPGSRVDLGEARIKGDDPQRPVHQLTTFNYELHFKGHPSKGYLLANHLVGGPVTATGNGVAIQLPAVAADEEVVAALIESDAPGSAGDNRTLDAKTRSATDQGFTAGAVDRHIFQQIDTDPAAEWAIPIPGPLPALWWRIEWTVAGDNPNYYPVAAIGVRQLSTT